MKFHAIKAIKIGHIFSITLMALADPIDIKCQVMWCREAASVYEEGHHFGVRFQDLRLVSLIQLRKLIIAREV